jgi:transketolase
MSNLPITTTMFANEVRKLTLKMIYEARASHIGGALSMTDILAVLYNDILHIYPLDYSNANRDRFLLSKGHACASLYATLAMKGFFAVEELKTYAKDGSIFLSHSNHNVPGVEVSAGSLGHSLPISCGLALAAKRKELKWKTYCLISDGELDEGSNWESILFAPQLKLDNLILVVDYNKIQSLGSVADVLDLNPLKEKFYAFRWEVFEVDGHDHDSLREAFTKADNSNTKPKVIIAHTIKGKGISFMENKLLWHYKSPTIEQYNDALKELSKNEDSLH